MITKGKVIAGYIQVLQSKINAHSGGISYLIAILKKSSCNNDFQLQNVLLLNKNYEQSDVWEKLRRI